MSDYASDFPLWGEGSDLSPEFVSDPVLRGELVAWNQLFLDDFSHERGWLNEESRAHYSMKAPELISRLEELLGPEFEVIADLWPVEPSGNASQSH